MTEQTDGANTLSDNVTTNDNAAVPSFLLPPWVVRILDLPRGACETDCEYLDLMVAEETVRLMVFQVAENLGKRVFSFNFEGTFPDETDEVCVRGRQLGVRLQSVLRKLTEKRVAGLNVEGGRQPIVEKFLDAMKATDVHRKVFRHVLARASGLAKPSRNESWSNGGVKSPSVTLHHSSASSSVTILVTVPELLELFPHEIAMSDILPLTESQSPWVKEQVYTRQKTQGIFVSQMDSETLRIFFGGDVTPLQYQSVGSQLLQKMLLEDSLFCQTETGKAILRQKDRASRHVKAKKPAAKPSFLAQALTETNPSEGQRGVKRDRLFEVLAVASKRSIAAAAVDEKDNTREENSESVPIESEKDEMEIDNVDKSSEGDSKDEFGPYQSDLSYLQDQIRRIDMQAKLIQIKAAINNSSDDYSELMNANPNGQNQNTFLRQQLMIQRNPDRNMKLEREAEKLERKLKQLTDQIRTKMLGSQREFRLEQLAQALELQEFEKNCILDLVKNLITMRGSRAQVGQLIQRFCSTLEEKMKTRRFFYKSSTLVRESILTLHQTDFMMDLSMCSVELDRRLFDYVVGLDTEMSEIVDGSHLYLPDVDLEDVVLPSETKKRVCDSVLNYEKVRNRVHELEIDRKITYGLGQVLLFYGASGTGKTMLANAIAKRLSKKVLLVNFPSLGSNESGALIKFLFREARINRALLFFDECESLFLSRDKGGRSVNMILTELERFEGLCVLATNRAHDLDEAMHRRVSLAIEFRKPDHILREKIWKTLQPPKLPLEDNINFGHLAKKYELSGGLIKNAWLQSVSLMVRSDREKVSEADLVQAAGEQVVGQLSMESFDRRVVPTCGIDSVILTAEIKQSLNNIVQYTKAQSVLFGQWGFEKIHRSTTGISALFAGAPGTGKTMAAEAVGFDLGRPLLVVNVAELVSKWVGETSKNISSLFTDAKKKDAVLVFDEAEGLFGSRESSNGASTSRHDTMNVGLLLQYVEEFPGVCIVITNIKSSIDEAFFRRFRFVLNFDMPDSASRERIWKMMVPDECPVSKDVSYRDLASRFEMCGGDIKNALLRASTTAALRADELRVVTMADLTDACSAEISKLDGKFRVRDMYV